MYAPAKSYPLTTHAELPAELKQPRRSLWCDINIAGAEAGCFLEGPDFDAAGNLYVVDIPFGRIFRLAPDGNWSLVTEYDGWPNGLKVEKSGTLLVADFKLGLVRVDPTTGKHEILFDHVGGEPLLGLNDLTWGPDGSLYVTDQGQTGLHDPRGRVLRVRAGGTPTVLVGGCPSPNGLVFDRHKPWLYVAMTRDNAVWRIPLYAGEPVKAGIAIQLSGGIGPDGIAQDSVGRLLVAHLQIGVWHFDLKNRPIALYELPEDTMTTNLVVRENVLYVTDSVRGRILTSPIMD